MFLDKIFQFAKGYVILYLEGCSIERFLNLTLRQNIRLFRLKKKEKYRAMVCVYRNDFPKIRPAARITRTRVRILKKCGLPAILKRVRKRTVFAAGFLMFLLCLGITSQFLWSVEVRGVPEEEAGEILSAAELAGVRVGAWIPGLPDGNERKDTILQNTSQITWAWVYVKGTKAVVEVRKATLPPTVVDPKKACNVVAARDGVICQMIVKEGSATLEKGEPVLPGDILISGETSDGLQKHAQGEVYAYTWHKASGKFRRTKTSEQLTGENKNFYILRLFSREIPLYFRLSVPYEEYRLEETSREFLRGRDGYLGIGFRRLCYREKKQSREPLSDETVCEIARCELEEQIAENLLPGAKKQGEDLQFTPLDDDWARVTLVMNFIEQIGQEQEIVQQE